VVHLETVPEGPMVEIGALEKIQGQVQELADSSKVTSRKIYE